MNGDDVFEKVVTEVFSPLYELVAAVSFVYFLYGVFMFIISMNDPEKKNFGKQHMLWGTVGLFIILSVGALLKWFNAIFGGMFVY